MLRDAGRLSPEPLRWLGAAGPWRACPDMETAGKFPPHPLLHICFCKSYAFIWNSVEECHHEAVAAHRASSVACFVLHWVRGVMDKRGNYCSYTVVSTMWPQFCRASCKNEQMDIRRHRLTNRHNHSHTQTHTHLCMNTHTNTWTLHRRISQRFVTSRCTLKQKCQYTDWRPNLLHHRCSC